MMWDLGFFSNGNVLSRIDFAVFKLLNIGLSLELDRIIGCGHVKIAIPALYVKFRVYDGNMALPVVAAGYDGQGYFFDSDLEQRKRQSVIYCCGQRVSY